MRLKLLEPARSAEILTQAHFILQLGIVLFLILALGESYQSPNWLRAAIINSCLFILVLCAKKHPWLKRSAPRLKMSSQGLYFLPALSILFFACLLALITKIYAKPLPAKDALSVLHLASVFWIPIIEEGVFRFGIGNILRNRLGFWTGSYLSIVIFVILHGPLGFASLGSLELSFSLGVFLMAIACECLYNLSESLYPAIAFHAACNATIPIFTLSDPRIFTWLSPFYY